MPEEHVLTCLIPAFFIAGAIAVFCFPGFVLKYFGATANKILSYSVAFCVRNVLAVCSCTVLPFLLESTCVAVDWSCHCFPLFRPAINVLAIVLTARILGWENGSGQGRWRQFSFQ